MAFDGITIANITKDMSDLLTGGRIYKIAQTESDELLITVKLSYENIDKYGIKQAKMIMSADASLPLIYMTDETKPSPMTAPNFCMLLRKHIQNGRIISVTQPGLERIIRFEIEHLDEMGDLRHKVLLIEIMGLCTDICVVSNALLLKAHFPEARIAVNAGCCAGVTPEKHEAALETMRSCQIDVI